MEANGTKGLVLDEPLIFEKSSPGRVGIGPAHSDVPEADPSKTLPSKFLRKGIEGFPDISEMDAVRHYTRLSQWNFGLDSGFYPLGSCTMKYNPKINEAAARLPGFAMLHPYQPEHLSQGALELMHSLENYLAEITGMEAITLQPSAGAHGELCGLLMMAAYFKAQGKPRTKIIIPDTAHGTNPASSHLAGFKVVPVKTEGKGALSVEMVKAVMDEDTAGLMLTNPNTIGLFEKNIKEIAEVVHSKGGLMYCDGANMNAVMGLVKLGDLGVDVVQLNLHKTFSTPHGGGGPGSGPVGVGKALEPFLPCPRIKKDGGKFSLDFNRPNTIGRMKAFYGNFSIMVRAYSYIRRMGASGLRRASETAILNANYIKERLKGTYHLAFDEPCMHEAVFSDKFQLGSGISTMDIAKRLIDYGYHPPTVYFPLVVHGAIMIEPTETETIDTLDRFIDVMKAIAEEAKTDPQLLKDAPNKTKIRRVDETRAAREPILRWKKV
ncbi:MAG TPA: aminomethyl-transferring glycine dehydrogenase subunit GcvPB [Syntrophales bacterium]|nr:MAG: glycine dehydrogenase (aminomethyl-transferring) [Deltaproteobacteria bacterium GWA2_54_12]HLE18992.1 aminomethyl-transferring glycine dehydrogenase subunit GcvPB [Syntrophales bacterium]